MRFSRLHDAVPGGRGTPPQIRRRNAPGVIACAGTERAFVRAPDSTNKTEDQRTYSTGSTGCLVATRAGYLPSVTAAVRRGAMSLIFPTGGPSPASSGPGTDSFPKAAGAAIAGRATTDPRYPDPQPGIASSFGLLAGPGGRHQPRLVPAHGPGPAPTPLGPLTKGTGGQESLAQEIPRCRRPGRRSGQYPGAAWCRLCSDRAGHGGVHGTVAWGTRGARYRDT